MSEPVIIAPEGELDLHAARASLGPELQQAAGTGCRLLIVDLSRVTFIDSTGLGTMLQTHQRLRRQGREMRIVAPPGSAAAVVIDLAGLRPVMAIHTSVDEAMEAAGPALVREPPGT